MSYSALPPMFPCSNDITTNYEAWQKFYLLLGDQLELYKKFYVNNEIIKEKAKYYISLYRDLFENHITFAYPHIKFNEKLVYDNAYKGQKEPIPIVIIIENYEIDKKIFKRANIIIGSAKMEVNL